MKQEYEARYETDMKHRQETQVGTKKIKYEFEPTLKNYIGRPASLHILVFTRRSLLATKKRKGYETRMKHV